MVKKYTIQKNLTYSVVNNTIVSTPHLLSPISSVWGNLFVFNNLSSTATNFKYVTKLYVNGVYTIKELLPPRPSTGYGNYSGYIPIRTSLTYNLNPSVTQSTYATNSISKYYVAHGMEWNPELSIGVQGYSPGFTVVGTYSYWGFSFSTNHGLTAGDYITIQSQNPYFTGTQTIISTGIADKKFFTDKIFSSASYISTGQVTDAIRMAGTSSTYWAYNGTRQYGEGTRDFTSLIFRTASSVTPQFLTNYIGGLATVSDLANGKPILESSRETLSCFIYPGNYTYNVSLYSPTYSFLSNTSMAFSITSSSTMSRIDLPVGTWNLRNSSMGISFSNVGAYYVYLTSGSTNFTGTTQSRGFKIDRDCYSYANVRLMFLNSYGAFDYVDFHLDDKKSYKIKRNEYRQELNWDYTLGDRNRTIMSQTAQEEHVVNTNWLSEDQYAWLSELVTSPEVYEVDDATGYIYPVIVTDTNFTFKTSFRDQLFNLQLTYEMSYQQGLVNQ